MASVASTGVSPGADSTTCVITKPASLAAGNLMIAAITKPAAATDVAPPNVGWVVMHRGTYHWWFSKIADSSDVAASNFTFTLNSSGSNIGVIARITGFNAAVHMGDVVSAGSSGTNAVSPTVTFKSANSLLIAITANNVNLAWTGSVSNANVTLTEQRDIGTTAGVDCSMAFYSGAWNGTSSADTTFTGNRGSTSGDMDLSVIMVYDTNDFSGEATTVPLYRHMTLSNGSTIYARPDLQVGDLLVAYMAAENSGTPTPPTGWESLRNGDSGGSGSFGQLHTSVWAKIADAADVATPYWSFSVPFGNCWTMLAKIAYADPTDPIDGSDGAAVVDATASPPNIMPTMAGFTPTVTDTLFMMFTGQRRVYASVGTRYLTTSNPTWVERYAGGGYNWGQGNSLTVATGQRASAAATGTSGLSGTNAGYADEMNIAMLNIKPIQPSTFVPRVMFM